jgi:uncharacterized RDD family membrane protein YckC
MQPTNQIQGEGTRIAHFFLDTLFIFIGSFIAYRWYNFNAFFYGFRPIRFGEFFFLFYLAYIFLFEFLFQRTPAKWMTKTKVVTLDGRRPAIWQFIIRALVRTSLVSMFGLAWNGKPLHDTFSKTILVSTDKPNHS